MSNPKEHNQRYMKQH